MATVKDSAFNDQPLDQSMDNNRFSITPSDTDELRVPIDGIYVGVAGNVACVCNGNSVTLTLAAGGPYFVGQITQVKATGTTATGLVGVASKALR